MKKRWKLKNQRSWSTEGYWASYSDLMAGILLIFAVAAASALIEFTSQAPPDSLTQWNQFLNTLCDDEQLQNEPSVDVDCVTGSLIIKDSELRYALNEARLFEPQKQLLLRTVPLYLQIVKQHLVGQDEIQIQGIEVGGHTDSTGTYEINVDLSSQRARNVLLFLKDAPEMIEFQDLLQEKGFSIGYADSRPPDDKERRPTEWDEARRIELKVHVNTATILDEISNFLRRVRETAFGTTN